MSSSRPIRLNPFENQVYFYIEEFIRSCDWQHVVLIPLRIRSISTAALPKPRRARVCGPVCANLGAVNPF